METDVAPRQQPAWKGVEPPEGEPPLPKMKPSWPLYIFIMILLGGFATGFLMMGRSRGQGCTAGGYSECLAGCEDEVQSRLIEARERGIQLNPRRMAAKCRLGCEGGVEAKRQCESEASMIIVGAVIVYAAIPLGIFVLWGTFSLPADKGLEEDTVVRLRRGEAGPDTEGDGGPGGKDPWDRAASGRAGSPGKNKMRQSPSVSSRSSRSSSRSSRSSQKKLSDAKRMGFRQTDDGHESESVEEEEEPTPRQQKNNRAWRKAPPHVMLRCQMCQMCYEAPPPLGGRGFLGADSSPAVCPNPSCGYIMSGIL